MPKIKTQTEQVTFRIKSSSRKLAASRAEQLGITESEFIRDAIAEKLHRDKAQESLIRQLQDLMATVRGLRSAIRLSHAATIALTKMMMICTREPVGEALQAALEKAPEREEVFRKFVLDEWGKDDPVGKWFLANSEPKEAA